MKIINPLSIAVISIMSMVTAGCSQDSPLPGGAADEATEYIYTLSLGTPDASRALYPYEQDDMLYLTFFSAGRSIPAWARYDAEYRLWNVHASSALGENEYGTVNLAYFMHAPGEETFSTFAISPANLFFMARNVDYSVRNSVINITTTLQPQGTRLRFVDTGTDEARLEITGLNTYKNWYPERGEFDSKPFTDDMLRPESDGLASSYRSVFLVNANPQNTSLNFLRVLKGDKVMTYPYDDYKAMFEAGSVATIDLRSPKYSDTYTVSKLVTPHTVTNTTDVTAAKSVFSAKTTRTGGFRLQGSLIVKSYSGSPSDAVFAIRFSNTAGTVFYEKNVLPAVPLAEGETFEFDVNFCVPEYVGKNTSMITSVAYSMGSYTFNNLTLSNF